MPIKVLILLFAIVLPGVAVSTYSAYFLFPEWTALDASYQQYQKVARSSSPTVQALLIAEAAENRHRINCFAEGVGVLLGGVVAAIGVHGLCTVSKRSA